MAVCPSCATELVGDDACPLCHGGAPICAGTIVDGRYRVERVLGHGGMSVVYLAQDMNLLRHVAIKMLAPKLSAREDLLDAFRREAGALARIRDPHVVQIFAFGAHEHSAFFALEYIEGSSLSAIINEHDSHHARVSPLRAITILTQIARGLGAVHKVGAIHRDVKPSNVIIESRTGRPVLIDFGLVVPAETRLGATVSGTPEYMAPELWMPNVGVLAPSTDIYALGVTAYELITGNLPFVERGFAGWMAAHIHRPPPAPSSVDPVLKPFDEPVLTALAKKPEQRFRSAYAFANALERAGADLLAPKPSSLRIAVSADRRSPHTRALEVLIVDDDPLFRSIARRAVQQGFSPAAVHVETASSGEDALAIAADSPPDLVLLDYTMPGLDGLDTLARLRALPGGLGARVVVVSATVGTLAEWRFRVLGVAEFFAKSEGPTELVALVSRLRDDLTAEAAPANS